MNETGIRNLPPLKLPTVENPPVALPAPEAAPVVESVEMPAPPVIKPAPPAPERSMYENPLFTLLAWGARCFVGICMIANAFPLSFITAIAAFGWLQRRMLAITLRGWWKQSPRRLEGTFQAFCDTLGDNAPVERPRWFWRERIVSYLNRPRQGTGVRRLVGTLFTFVTLPVHSLYLNFRTGIAGLFATYMLTGWPCSIMLFSWYFGWLNSFHKGYEDAFLGLGFGLLGGFLLILTFLYVPMAQAHQAAAGEIAAFFQFRVVIRLILTRLTAYTFLIAGLVLTAAILDVFRIITLSEDIGANLPETTPQEAYWMLQRYWFFLSFFFFLALLTLRTVSALIYRSAMLKAIRAGTVLTTDLPPRLALWFERLEIMPQAQVPQQMIWTMLKTTIATKYRVLLLGTLFLMLLLFVLRFYVGYFLVFSEYRGILNHPVIQVPCIDWTPWHLILGQEE